MAGSIKSDPMAQHYVECEFCECRPAQHFCNTCPGSMCDLCKDEHKRKKVFQHHKVTSLALSRKENILCPDHDTRCCELYCRPCQKPVCCECITEKHKSHTVDKISFFLDQKRNILEQIQTIENILIPAHENVLSETKSQIDGMAQLAAELSTAVQKQTETIIHAVRSAESEYLSKIDKNKNDAISAMKEDDTIVQDKIKRLRGIKGTLQNLYEKHSFDSELLNKQISSMEEMKTLPETTSCTRLTLVTGQIDAKMIQNHIGNLSLSAISKRHGSPVCSPSESIDSFRKSKKVILPVPRAVLQTDLEKQSDIVYLGKDSVVISGRCKEVRVVGISKQMKKIKMKLPKSPNPTGISLTKDHRIIYTEKSERKVMSLSLNSDIRTLFTLKGNHYPVGPCVTEQGDICLCLLQKYDRNDKDQCGNVVKFTILGDSILDINERNGKTLFKCPGRVTENPANADIIVSDPGSKVVFAFDSVGKLKFKYNGKALVHLSSFNPQVIAADDVGHILITDHNNDAIHMLSQDGDPLTLLLAGEVHKPGGICFDGIDSIWVVENMTGKTKVFKYLEDTL